LAIAPKGGDLAEIIDETQSGVVVDFHEKQKLREEILSFYTKYKEQNLRIESKNIEQYNRQKIAMKLNDLLKKINTE